jgi:hypothetical protein
MLLAASSNRVNERNRENINENAHTCLREKIEEEIEVLLRTNWDDIWDRQLDRPQQVISDSFGGCVYDTA